MNRLMGASLFTLSLLVTFVMGVILAAMVYVEYVSLSLALGMSVVINFLMWWVGPTITDWINRRFYQMSFMEFEQVKVNYPQVAAMLEKVAGEYSFPIPKIGIIPDQNPTAFTYGSHRGNARIVLT